MQIINSIYEKINDNVVLCIGNFDGIHVAHQKIISSVINYAKENSFKSMVITFKQHPFSILNSGNIPKRLMPLDEKIKIIEKMGVDYLGLYDFAEVRNLSAEKFLRYLSQNYNMKKIFCGFNFRFGNKNKGNIQYLRQMSQKFGYELEVFESMKISNKKVSSTKVRTYIKFGEIEKANRFLGRFFNIKGVVVKGKQLGRQLGFPTANIEFNPLFCIPQNGVYATITEFKDRKFPSMTNIGYNPTFKNKYISIETNILDFSEDLYGETIKVNFVKKLRNEVLFSDVHSLVDQLVKDRNDTYQITKKYLK